MGFSTDNSYSSKKGDSQTENTTYRSLVTLNGHTFLYVNTWYKYTLGIVTWVTLGDCNLINFHNFTEIVFPSSIYLDLGGKLALNWKVLSSDVTYNEAAILKRKFTAMKYSVEGIRKQIALSAVRRNLRKMDNTVQHLQYLGMEQKKVATQIKNAECIVKAISTDCESTQAKIEQVNAKIQTVGVSNRNIANKVRNVNARLNNRVNHIASSNVVLTDQGAAVYM